MCIRDSPWSAPFEVRGGLGLVPRGGYPLRSTPSVPRQDRPSAGDPLRPKSAKRGHRGGTESESNPQRAAPSAGVRPCHPTILRGGSEASERLQPPSYTSRKEKIKELQRGGAVLLGCPFSFSLFSGCISVSFSDITSHVISSFAIQCFFLHQS